jgi:hypothetical protein
MDDRLAKVDLQHRADPHRRAGQADVQRDVALLAQADLPQVLVLTATRIAVGLLAPVKVPLDHVQALAANEQQAVVAKDLVEMLQLLAAIELVVHEAHTEAPEAARAVVQVSDRAENALVANRSAASKVAKVAAKAVQNKR